ncbi:MAG: type III pantothenate kinase [Lentisphaeria bacterium]
MRFLLNIGNSNTQVARELACGGLELTAILPTSQIERLGCVDFLEQETENWQAVAACVVPSVQKKLQNRYPGKILFLSAASYPDIDFSFYDIQTLGADRIANAAAARALKIGAVLVVDCGTCITTEAIDGNGVFRGGAILPGRTMLRRSLAAFTAQLPEIPLTEECPLPLGKTTVQAIAAGVDLGVIGAVREIIAKTKQEPALAHCRVIVIGGDAAYFVANISELEPGTPHFTLQGIRLAKG